VADARKASSSSPAATTVAESTAVSLPAAVETTAFKAEVTAGKYPTFTRATAHPAKENTATAAAAKSIRGQSVAIFSAISHANIIFCAAFCDTIVSSLWSSAESAAIYSTGNTVYGSAIPSISSHAAATATTGCCSSSTSNTDAAAASIASSAAADGPAVKCFKYATGLITFTMEWCWEHAAAVGLSKY
jgi:hypothetical protein